MKGGHFKQIYNKAVKTILDQQQDNTHGPSVVENLEIELVELIYNAQSFLDRFFLFFQGLTSGK